VSDQALEPVIVSARTELTPGFYSLRFRLPFPFVPGECLPLAVGAVKGARRYSLANGPRDPQAEILFDVVEGGELSPLLAALSPGDTLLVGRPVGTFRDVEGPGGRAVWIAAGTGIAPFLAMVRGAGTAGRVLVHGSRTLAGLLYREELQQALGNAYVPCCSSESGNGVFPGRLTAYLASAELDQASRYLLCGNPTMVVDVRDLLIGRGIPFDHILSEIYF
jgi:ferredoxin/flavodoxin---NADP+ reductase